MAKKKPGSWLTPIIILVCLGVALGGGLRYISSLRGDLRDQAIGNVLTVTVQQQQAFDNFLSGDRERLHSYAHYFSQDNSDDIATIQSQLAAFVEVDAFYSVIDLDTGRYCNNKSDTIFQMGPEELEVYRGLTGSGVRDPYTGLYSNSTMFGSYECFTFANGARGLLQKSYDTSRVIRQFSLSFYNDQGFAYVVNRQGGILLRSEGAEMIEGELRYDNILEMLALLSGEQQNTDRFIAALDGGESGSMILAGSEEPLVCTYVPLENAEDWRLVSIVPLSAITTETNRILLNSQRSLLLLGVLLLIGLVVLGLIWNTQRNMRKKDEKIEYQEQLFDIFSTYLANSTDDVYMMADLEDGTIEYVSPNLERVLGVTEAYLRATPRLVERGLCGSRTDIDPESLRAMSPGEVLKTVYTERVNSGTGEHRWFRENVYCTEVQGRRKLVVYISDRTQERKIQNAMGEALDIARTANSAKSAFLSNVSHDIRTPMNAIIGFVALLRQEPDNPEQVLEYTQRIDAASQHLLGLINDVLDINKIESGSTTLNMGGVDLAEIIDEINNIIRPQTRAKNQSFDISTAGLVHEHLMGDKLRINQVLINLLSNAVKYTPEGGSIQMRVEELPQVVENYSRVRFTVSDNGLGMSEDYQKVLFDPFTREDTASTRRIQGTGLGMAITKSLVDLMDGAIHVTSELGKGSTFTVELELQIQKQEVDPGFWGEHGVKRMIVTDDDEETCKNVVRIMAGTGVVTDYATDGETAVRMMRESREAGKPYDLILLDWMMPGLDGLETARLIRKNYCEKIPILLLTAYDWGEIEQEAREIGVSHFISKPFFMSTFKEAIRRIMGGLEREERENAGLLKGRYILVVDDIEVNRIILVKILGTLGAVCDIAGDGQEALEKFRTSAPDTYDAILMDVQMPVMGGYEATRAIRSCGHPSAKAVPIVAMTANAFVDDVRDAIESGMNAHIAKPIQVDRLKAVMSQVLGNRKQQETKKGRNLEQ